MSYPEEPYTGPERRKYDDIDPIRWEWPPRQPQPDDISPDVEGLLSDLEVGVDMGQAAEEDDAQEERMVLELQERLAIMGVEDPKSLDISKFRDVGTLIFADFSLEDIHHDVYMELMRNDFAGYVSVKVDDILGTMPSDDRMPIITELQRDQTKTSVRYLISLGINPQEIISMAGSANAHNQFELRCLERLMKEKYLKGLARDLKRKYNDSWEEPTVEYPQVVYDAVRTINLAIQSHKDRVPSTTDGKLWHKLEGRALVRALSFARPLTNQDQSE